MPLRCQNTHHESLDQATLPCSRASSRGLVIATSHMQRCVLPLVAPWRRWIELNNLMTIRRLNLLMGSADTYLICILICILPQPLGYVRLASLSEDPAATPDPETGLQSTEMTATYCWASIAASPRHSTFSDKRCLNSDRES